MPARETSDMLQFLRVRRIIDLGQPEMHAPWALTLPAGTCYLFHVRGAPMTLRAVSGVKCRLGDGDIAIALRAEDVADWPPSRLTRFGGEGPKTHMLGVRFQLEPAPGALQQALPAIFRLAAGTIDRLPAVKSILNAIVDETGVWREAQGAAVARLIESLLVQLMRAYAEHDPAGGDVILHALGDRYVARAVSLIPMQANPDVKVGALARDVGLSHSSFTRRFTRQIGEAPREHLLRRRIQTAMLLLVDSDIQVGEIAARVGYESQTSFGRAFKRVEGLSPLAYRHHMQQSAVRPLRPRSGRTHPDAAQ